MSTEHELDTKDSDNEEYQVKKSENTADMLKNIFSYGTSLFPHAIIMDPNITPQAKATYFAILKYAWFDGMCYPGQKTLAKHLGTSDRTVRRYLKELKDYGLIEWEKRGPLKTNMYSLLDKDMSHLFAEKRTELSEAKRTRVSNKLNKDEVYKKYNNMALTSLSHVDSLSVIYPVIRLYFEIYEKDMREKHPFIKHNQLLHVASVLKDFDKECCYDLNLDSWRDFIDCHFYTADRSKTNMNINHFASRKLLERLHYSYFYRIKKPQVGL